MIVPPSSGRMQALCSPGELPAAAPGRQRARSGRMSLSDLSIKNPVFAVMLSAAMIVFGYLGYHDMAAS